MRQFLLVAGILGGGISAFAQTTPAPAPDSPSAPTFSETVVVSATLTPVQRDNVSAAVTVIDKQEIAARQARNLSDLVATVPGLAVVTAGSPGQQTSLFTRGTDSNQTLLLWNGLQLNDPYFGGVNWQFVPTDGVERVEVARGPFSALYGSNAVGGVISVVTGSARGGSLHVEGGDNGYFRGGLAGGWNALGGHADVAGHVRRGDGEIANDFFDSEELVARELWTVAPGMSLGLLARGNESQTGIPFSGDTPTPHRRISWNEREVAVPWNVERGDWTVETQLSDVRFDNTYRDPDDPSGFTAGDTRSQALRGRTVASWQAGRDLRLSFGTEAERLQVTDSSSFGVNLDGAHQRTWAAFGEAGYGAGPLRLDVGLRRDDNDVYGGQTSLRLGGVASLGAGTRLRASYGEAFRAPSLGELFFPFSGNPDLQPERSRSYELGLERDAGPWRFALTGFENRQRNLIDFDFATFRDVNVGRARSRGAEGEVTYRHGMVTVRLNGTRLSARDLTTGQPLLRRPNESANLFLALLPARWTLSLTARQVGERPDVDPITFAPRRNPGYLRLDLAASFRALSWLSPYARIDNAGDRKYAEALGFPTPGRTLIGGLAVEF
ncbi:MAG TPA: TonB-dependent receptor [Thermoanaerobaculia bacterium]|nr:TonB-dependent receptor [Thermoanaerobaculia bacterium]